MVAKINYNEIKNLKPEESYYFIESIEKGLVKDIKVSEILNMDLLDRPLIEFYYSDLSPRGVYMFFDNDGICRYIGQTNKSFYERLLTQLDTTHYPVFAWNTLLSIMSCMRTGKPHADLCEEDHEEDLKVLLNYRLLLIEVDRVQEIDGNNLTWIEKILLKTFREIDDGKLLNNRIGWLANEQWQMTIDRLIR